MLPNRFRPWLFDRLSVKSMRYVDAVPEGRARGLTKTVYDMIDEDFFIHGSLTSRRATSCRRRCASASPRSCATGTTS
jgi:hypothetical protein